MTIQITKPELEALINERLQSGAFKDAEDVILQALQYSAPQSKTPRSETAPQKTIEQLFAPIRGMADDLDFSRNPSTGHPVDLS